MFGILIFVTSVLTCYAQSSYYAPIYVRSQPVRYVAPIAVKESPKPYSFSYEAPAIGGGSSRQESSDGNGRVVGSYTVSDADGRLRVVEYYADETGFHANVKTNEPGTANQDSADVSLQSFAAPPNVPAPYYAPVRAVPRRVVVSAPVPYGVQPSYSNVPYIPRSYSSPYYPPFPYYK